MKKSIAVIALLLSLGVANASDFTLQYKHAVEATVLIEAITEPIQDAERPQDEREPGRSLGTGWIYEDRFIVTSTHVVDMKNVTKDTKITVTGNDRPAIGMPVRVLYRDVINDVAILEMGEEDWNFFNNIENPTTL